MSHDRRGLHPVFEVLLLIWVLAIFYAYYSSQGFFALLQQLASPVP